MTGSTGHQPVRSATPAAAAMRPARCGGMTLATSALCSPNSVTKVRRRRIDRRHLAAGRQADPLDQARIELAPGRLEQPLLGEHVLGVEDDELRARLPRLEVMGDEARPLVRPRRAAERIGRRRDDDRAAVGHGFELTPQQRGLRARLPGMRHGLDCALRVAGQRAEAEVDARRQDEPVVIEGRRRRRASPGVLADRPPSRPGGRRRVPSFRKRVVAELLRLEVAQAGDHGVAQGAGGKSRARLDERDRQARPPQLAGAARPAEASADHDDARRGLRERRPRERRTAAPQARALTTVRRLGANGLMVVWSPGRLITAAHRARRPWRGSRRPKNPWRCGP